MIVHVPRIAFAAWLMAGPIQGNVEPIAPEEVAIRSRLIDLQWATSLSEDDVGKVLIALKAKNHSVIEAVITVIAVHNVAQARSILHDGVGNKNSYSRPFGKIVAEGLNQPSDCSARLRPALGATLAGDEDWQNRGKTTGGTKLVRELITSAIVINEAKAIRAARKSEPDLDGLEPSPFEQRLLTFAKMEPQQVFDEIVTRLSGAQIAGRDEYWLAEIMRTYGQQYVPRVLDRLAQTESFSKYGRKLLMDTLWNKCADMSDANAERLGQILDANRAVASPIEQRTIDALKAQLDARNTPP